MHPVNMLHQKITFNCEVVQANWPVWIAGKTVHYCLLKEIFFLIFYLFFL